VLNERAEENPSNPKLFFGVLVEEAVLVEQVVNHARENFLLPLVGRALEPLQHFDHLYMTRKARE